MNDLDLLLARARALAKGPDAFDAYVSLPGWVRDNIMAVDRISSPDMGWTITESIVAHAASSGPQEDIFQLAMLLNAAAPRPVEINNAHSHFFRENSPGTMFLRDLNVPSQKCQGTGPFHSLSLAINGSQLRKRMNDILGREVSTLDVLFSGTFRDIELETALKLLLSHARRRDVGQRLVTEQLVDRICRQLLVVAKLKPQEITDHDRLRPASIERTLEYIHAHWTRDLGVDELAGVAGVSASHFFKLFRQTMGEPPKRYIMRLRIERSCNVLRQQPRETSIESIARLCGFYDASHFSREFIRQYGVTPNAFRQM